MAPPLAVKKACSFELTCTENIQTHARSKSPSWSGCGRGRLLLGGALSSSSSRLSWSGAALSGTPSAFHEAPMNAVDARSHTSGGCRPESGVSPAGGRGSGTEGGRGVLLFHRPSRSTSHEHDGSVKSASHTSCASSGPPSAARAEKLRLSSFVASPSHSRRSRPAARLDNLASAQMVPRSAAAVINGASNSEEPPGRRVYFLAF